MDKAKQGSASAVATGLRGVVAASSSIGDVNGEKGELIYQGIDIHDLATKSTFEEVVFLLWNGKLPKRAELDELRANIGASYEIPQWVRGPIEYFPKDAEPMDTLRKIFDRPTNPLWDFVRRSEYFSQRVHLLNTRLGIISNTIKP